MSTVVTPAVLNDAYYKQKTASRVGTGVARSNLQMFVKKNSKWQVNKKLLEHLDTNPLSFKLPSEYVYNNMNNTIDLASDWLTTSRKVKNQNKIDFEFVGDNYIDVKLSNALSHTSFNNMVATYAVKVKKSLKGGQTMDRAMFKRFQGKLTNHFKQNNGLRVQFSAEVLMTKTDGTKLPPQWIGTPGMILTDIKNLPMFIADGAKQLRLKVEQAQMKGSGLIFIRAVHNSINLLKFNPLRSGGTFIPTPKELVKKKAIVNVKDSTKERWENRCFELSILACLHYDDLTNAQQKNRDRPQHYEQYASELEWDDSIKFPIAPNDHHIASFEKTNNIAINIYEWNNKKKQIIILRPTTLNNTDDPTRRVARLLYNTSGRKAHFSAITNLHRLSLWDTNHNGKTYTCDYCLKTYTNKEAYERHQSLCCKHEHITPEMPEKGSTMMFKNRFNMVKAPGVIYSDFESYNQKDWEGKPDGVDEQEDVSHTSQISKQTPNSYKMLGVCKNGKKFFKTRIIEPSQTSQQFMRQFSKDLCYVEGDMRKQFQSKGDIKQMIWSDEQQKQHKKAKHCMFCETKFLTKLPPITAEMKLEIWYGLKEKHKDKTDTQITRDEFGPALKKQQEILLENGKKVRDHDHCDGQYIGPACQECNRNRHYKYFKIPVLFHNLKGYDGKLIIRECVQMVNEMDEQKKTRIDKQLVKIEKRVSEIDKCINVCEKKMVLLPPEARVEMQETIIKHQQEACTLECDKVKLIKSAKVKNKIDVIPLNSEKYISFGCGGLRFLDSQSFLDSSLDNLAKNLAIEKKGITKDFFKKKTGDLNLLLKKGVYPYSWVDSIDKFDLPELPRRKDFYNDLNSKKCSKEDYAHAQAVWKSFKCKTFRDYHLLYLQSDVCLLADIFEEFRTISLKTYELDPLYYYTLPGYSWDCMLKQTGIELELVDNYDMYLMIENGIRGGVSFISHRHSKAANKYTEPVWVEGKKGKFLLYVDANNLYGGAMMEALGYKDFKMLEPERIDTLIPDKSLETIADLVACDNPDEDHDGYIMTVDLECPEDLHDDFNAFPPLAENMSIHPENLSDYQRECLLLPDLDKDGNKMYDKMPKTNKLIPTLRDKMNYTLDIRLLHSAMQMGFNLKKVHSVIQFTQKAWLKPYIEKNSHLRANCSNDFEKDFYKLMNNSIFGKTMENQRNKMKFEIVTSKERMEKVSQNPRIQMPVISFGKDCSGVQYTMDVVKLNKPIYCGMSILDLSKITMYDFHYDRVMQAYGKENVKLLFTDTDSLCYEITTEDLYKDMATLPEFKTNGKSIFDTSNYHPDHSLHQLGIENKKVPGYFKDELGGLIMTEFIGLRSKMYSFTYQDPDERQQHKATHKGVKKCVNMTHEEYSKCLNEKKTIYKTFNSIRGKRHELYVVEMKKKALGCFDDKTYLLEDGITSLKWGHHRIPSELNIDGSCNKQ